MTAPRALTFNARLVLRSFATYSVDAVYAAIDECGDAEIAADYARAMAELRAAADAPHLTPAEPR